MSPRSTPPLRGGSFPLPWEWDSIKTSVFTRPPNRDSSKWGPTFLVLRTTERGLLLRGERSPVGRTLNLAWAEVTDVAQYHDRRRTVRGLILGGIAGAAAGGIIAAAVVGDVCRGVSGFCVGPESGAEAFAFGAVLGVLAGGAGGALIGTLINTSSWEPVVFPSVSLGLAAPRRVQLGVSLR